MSMNVCYFWCLFWASLFSLNLQLPLWKGVTVFKVIKGGTVCGQDARKCLCGVHYYHDYIVDFKSRKNCSMLSSMH